MGKVSGYSENTNPSRNDFALGETASGPATNRFKYDNILKLAKTTDLANPTKFRAYRNSDVATADSTNYTIIFSSEYFDTGSDYDTSTGEFVAPVSGFYQLDAGVIISGGLGAAGLWGAQLSLMNGASIIDQDRLYTYDHTTFTQFTGRISGMYELTAGDVITVIGWGDTANSSNWTMLGTTLAVFGGHLVSST